MDIWIYLTGAAALITNFFAYRAGSINSYRLISALAFVLLSTHFFLQGALAGAIGVAIGAVRNVVALRYNNPAVVVLFVTVAVGFCLWEWLVLRSPLILFIAYGSTLIFTIGSIVLNSATSVRRWFISAELLGLVYACLVGSGLGALFNISNLTSIGIKLLTERRLAQQNSGME